MLQCNYWIYYLAPYSSHWSAFLFGGTNSSFGTVSAALAQAASMFNLQILEVSGGQAVPCQGSCEQAGLCDSFVLVSKSAGGRENQSFTA